MKRIALLGASGQLGSDLYAVLTSGSAYEIIAVGRDQLDVEQTESIIPYLESLGPIDVLINCTAFHQTEQCEIDPLKAFKVNSIAVVRMAAYCRQHDALLVHFSTDYVFDGGKPAPYTEEDATNPLNMYGKSKVAGEQGIAAYLDTYFIFRVASLFGTAGSSGKGGNFIETMLRLARQNKPISIVHDVIMSPTHTKDVASVVKAFLDQGVTQYGIYHCAGKGLCSWHELAVEAIARCGLACETIPIRNIDYPAKCQRPLYSALDTSKLNRLYAMPSWQDALNEYLQLKGYVRNGGG